MTTSKNLIQEWIHTYNTGDAEKLAGFYHEEAVNERVSGHIAKGKQAIKDLYKEEFSAVRMQCEIESLHQDLPWIILEWKDSFGLRGCVFFRVTEGKILQQRSYWDTLNYAKNYNLPSSIH